MTAWLGQGGFRKKGFRRRDLLRLLGTGCAVTLCVAFVLISRPGLFEHMEHKAFDVLFSQTRTRPPSPVPVLIAIDDKALSRLGQWPWPRNILAGLVTRLHEAGADAVALDLVLSARDRTSPVAVLEGLPSAEADIRLKGLPPDFLDHDLALANALKKMPAVIGFKILFNDGQKHLQEHCTLSPLFPEAQVPPKLDPYAAKGVLCFLPALGQAAQGAGFTNALPDSDGVIRRVPLIARVNDLLVPGLTLRLATLAMNPALGLGSDLDGNFLQFGDSRHHIDARGNMLLRYRGPSGTFETFSVADILDGPVPDLSGRIAIVGPTAAGLGDNHITPLDRVFPGIEVHATILDNLLQKDSLTRPAWAVGAELFSVLTVGILSSLFLMVTGPLPCIAGFAGGALGIWGTSLWLLDKPGIWLSPLPAEMVLALNLAILSLIKYGMEERELRKRSQQLLQAQDATILGLTALAETRDPETGGHIKRTREYVLVLARCLARKPGFRARLNRETVELLHKSAPLHDIGKVGIADSILLKEGPLSDEERLRMQDHTILGAQTLAEAEKQTSAHADTSFLAIAREIAEAHHEKWDGSGYPYGLKGDDIPLGGRLMALADVYDALISKRAYKEPFSHEKAVGIILEGRGTHFDPNVVDAFVEMQDMFLEISKRYS